MHVGLAQYPPRRGARSCRCHGTINDEIIKAVVKVRLNCVMARAVVVLNLLVSAQVAIAPQAQALVATRMCMCVLNEIVWPMSANIVAKAPTGKCKTMQSWVVGEIACWPITTAQSSADVRGNTHKRSHLNTRTRTRAHDLQTLCDQISAHFNLLLRLTRSY